MLRPAVQHQQRLPLASFGNVDPQPANLNKTMLNIGPLHRWEFCGKRLLKLGIWRWHCLPWLMHATTELGWDWMLHPRNLWLLVGSLSLAASKPQLLTCQSHA